MIKMLTAYTKELDDIDCACEEILAQLDLARNTLKNAVGIIVCDSEFVDTGVVDALCKRLDFDAAGITTRELAVSGQYGFDILSITVLTSDDVRFSAVMTDSISAGNIDTPVEAAYRKGISGYKEDPSFILAYPPLLRKIGSSSLVAPLKRLCGNIPVFGSLTCDQTADFSTCKTILNGAAFSDTFAMILFFGEVHPRFFIKSLPAGGIQKQYALITDSKDFVVKAINDIPFNKYLEMLGFTPKNFENIYSIPFIINFHEGADSFVVARTLYSVTNEGYGIFGGEMPVGSPFTLGNLDANGVIETAKEIARKVVREDASCVLMYSCLSRNIMLGTDYEAELREMRDIIGNKMPYHCCYSGGEICPVPDASGRLVNRIHNFTFIACVLS
jgi:hypothetical protein